MFNFLKRVVKHYESGGVKKSLWFINGTIYNHTVKRWIHSDFHYWMSPERVLARRFELTLTTVNNVDFEVAGNYYVARSRPLTESSIVYSLGVLGDTSFDQYLADKYACQVFLFDPSIIATRHIKQVNHPRFHFQQVGVWSEAGEQLFYTPTYGGSPSMVLEYKGQKFTAPCKDLPSIMKEYGHTSIDLIKLDIEGAAFSVLEHMLACGIYPKQIVAEFERFKNGNPTEFFRFYQSLLNLMDKLAALGYRVYRMPREKYKYFSIELIFVRHEDAADTSGM